MMRLYVLVLLLIGAAPANAGSFTVFGPQHVQRASGAAIPVDFTFSAPGPGAYSIRLINGGNRGQFEKVSAAIVTLNGSVIFKSSDFNQQVPLLEKMVALTTNNRLTVEVRSGPGSGFTILILGADNTPPAISASASPAPNINGWNRTDVVVDFTCSDASGIARCTPPITVTTEGSNQTVTGTAVDVAGNSAATNLSISIDKTPPNLLITSPSGTTVSASPLNVTGTVADALSGVSAALCNGARAAVTNGTFSCSVPLNEGSNTITVQADDRAENTASQTVNVNLVTFVAPPPGPTSVAWMNVVGASASGNTLTKTAADRDWNSGAVSVQVIRDGYGYMEFTANQTNQERTAGLSFGDTNVDWSDLDYAIYLTASGTYRVYEAGIFRQDFGGFASGDRFRVEVRYATVRYLRNGNAFYTSAVPPRFPLRVDTALYSGAASIDDVQIGNFVWTNVVGASISRQSLAKTGAAGWNAGASSTNTIESGDGFVEFTASETNTTRAAGLGNGDADQSLSDIEFGIVLRSDGAVEVSESGTSRGVFGNYIAGDTFRVQTGAGAVHYFRNSIPFYTSTVAPAFPLRADTSLNSVGATISHLLLEILAWNGGSGVFVRGADVMKTDGTATWKGASSANVINSGDGWVEFTAIETNTRRVLGLKETGTASTYADIDFAIELTEGGIVRIHELGVLRGQFGSYANGDRFRIEIQNGNVQYRKDTALLYISTVSPHYPLHAEASLFTPAATIADVAIGDLVWINDAGVRFTTQTLSKTDATGWTAGAASSRAITSGYVEFTVSETNVERLIGLSNGDTNKDWTDVDFAVLLRTNGRYAVYEAGIHRADFGTASTGDRFRVELEAGGAVRYSRNGTVFYSSTVLPTLPLRVDTGIHGARGLLFNIVLSGAPATRP